MERASALLRYVLLASFVAFFLSTASLAQDTALKSWNDTLSKQKIIQFVSTVTTEGNAEFILPEDRIAVFDNDGTLWSEQPVYFQAYFVIDRIRELAPQHPEWKNQEPFASLLKGDIETALSGGHESLLEVIMATHGGMTTEEFERIVSKWIKGAKHPETGKPFTDMVYLPMLELLDYLRANGFKTFIVSGGGIEFMRPWTESVYGIPPEQVVGSSIKTHYEVRDGKPAIVRLKEINFIDDKEGKPVGIHQHIGHRPVMAFGNSDGDFQMLEWTTSGSGSRFGMLVHHTDAEREYAYDRDSHVGRLDRGLDEAQQRGWVIMDMKKDWNTVFKK